MITNKNIKGFTLVELAIVLVIIGVLAGTFIGTLGSRIDTTRRVETMEEMDVIKQALYGFSLSESKAHLPCPDCRTAACANAGNIENDGLEDRVGSVCDVDVAGAVAGELPIGNLPWRTLGLGYADSWGMHYSYWASPSITDDATEFLLTDVMALAEVDTRVGTMLTEISDKAVAIIISHGKNGYGAVTAQGSINSNPPAGNIDELRNVDDDLNFVARPKTDDGVSAAIGAFDDLVIWISEYELKAKMVEAGKLP